MTLAIATSTSTRVTPEQLLRMPDNSTLELVDGHIFFPPAGRPTLLTANDEITADGALPGFRCKVADLFPA